MGRTEQGRRRTPRQSESSSSSSSSSVCFLRTTHHNRHRFFISEKKKRKKTKKRNKTEHFSKTSAFLSAILSFLGGPSGFQIVIVSPDPHDHRIPFHREEQGDRGGREGRAHKHRHTQCANRQRNRDRQAGKTQASLHTWTRRKPWNDNKRGNRRKENTLKEVQDRHAWIIAGGEGFVCVCVCAVQAHTCAEGELCYSREVPGGTGGQTRRTSPSRSAKGWKTA